MQLPKVLTIVGQTASGKTALSLALAKEFDGELISADSRQVYRGMDVGSGKVTKGEQAIAPHHLIDVADPSDVYNVADFVRDGREAIAEITERKHLPIVVGGTFLYVDALLGKVSLPEVPPNEALRAELEQRSTEDLVAELQGKDPRRAAEIDLHNRVRLIRALEIIAAKGSVPPATAEALYDTLTIGLAIDPEVLHERIRTRLQTRFQKEGMIEEVARLHAEGVSWERLHSFGLEYRRIAEFLQGTITSREDLTELLERDIRNFAKRQMTWLKRDTAIRWFPYDAHEEIADAVRKWYRE